jgi:RNA polymerase sigma-70 factor (ECF subfamily)
MIFSDQSAPDDLPSTYLRHLVDRLRAGDEAASNELLRRAGDRLEGLAHRMLRCYPNVRRYEQTGDVLQGATLRLLRALGEVRPATTREFFGLAAEQIRRELLDLLRRHNGPQGWAANHESNAPCANETSTGKGHPEPVAPIETPAELERWTAFHEAVGELPAQEREVFNLFYYHGWTSEEVAEFLGEKQRAVRRLWRHARLRLSRLMWENK